MITSFAQCTHDKIVQLTLVVLPSQFREEMSKEVANKVTEMLKENYITLPPPPPPPLPSELHPRVTPPSFHPVPTPSGQQDPIDDLQISMYRFLMLHCLCF